MMDPIRRTILTTGAAATATFSPIIAVYMVVRLLLDLCGTGQPLWWGLPFLLAGAGIVMIASLRDPAPSFS